MLGGVLQKRFPKNFTPFFTEHLQWLLLTVSDFQPSTSLKKRLGQRYLSVKFANCLRTSLDKKTSGWLLLMFICEFWEIFQITSFIEHLWETAYLIYKLLNFNHHIQEKSISQVVFKHFIQEEEVAIRRRSCTLCKYLPWKLSVKKLIIVYRKTVGLEVDCYVLLFLKGC